MRSRTKRLLLVGLATSSLALIHCVGDEPSGSSSDDGGGDSGTPDNFVPPGDSGGPVDAGGDAATLCSAAVNGVVCGAGVNPCIIQIAGGGQSFCARDTSCNVYCWGDNRDGQLAADPATTAFSATPLKVNIGPNLAYGVDVGGAFDTAASGQSVVCTKVVAPTGGPVTLMCWGANEYGQLGVADAGPEVANGHGISSTPIAVPNVTNVGTVLVGALHACAITAVAGNPGVFDCWGDNNHGELGRNTTGNTDPNPLPSTATPIGFDGFATVGYQHTCVITTGNHVQCVGNNNFDQLGNTGSANDSDASTYSTVTGLVASQVVAAGEANCALTKTGSLVSCWGSNAQGQLGNGTFVTPNAVATVAPSLPAASAGGEQAGARNFCANFGVANLSDGGITPKIYCWGANDVGESFSPSDGGDQSSASEVTGLPNGKVVHIAMGGQASCVLMGDGTVWCWGENYHGELGNRGTGGNDDAVLPPGRVTF